MRRNDKNRFQLVGRGLLVGLTFCCWLCVVEPLFANSQENDQQNSGIVTVQFVVQLTEKASTEKNLFVAGNHRKLGNWRADGLALIKNTDSIYTGQIQVAVGTQLEFKVTQGSWATVEKSKDGGEISNRTLVAQAGSRQDVQLVHAKVEAWSDPRHSLKSSIAGQLILHRDVSAPGLKSARHVAVWLPPNYEDSDQRYPVLYLQDGQNLFDQATAAFGVEWRVDETAHQLIQQQKLKPIIIVGIWNTSDRLNEYASSIDSQYQHGGKADDYIRSLLTVIKPLIDSTYRTLPEREHTGIGGSSLGGLVSLYACMHYSDTFSTCLAMSPSLGWDREQLLKELERDTKRLADCRVWLDMGTKEGSSEQTQEANVQRARRLAKVLDHWNEAPVKYLEVPEGLHNEAAWADRLREALQFLYAQ